MTVDYNFPAEVLSFPEYDPSDALQVAAAEAAAEIREREQKELLRQLFKTYEGRAFLWLLMQEAGVGHSTFVGEMPLTMAYQQGRRDIGEWARNLLLTTIPEIFNLLRREAIEREQRYAQLSGLNDLIDEDETND